MPVTPIANYDEFHKAVRRASCAKNHNNSLTAAPIPQINSPTPIIIDFWAPWCSPCKVISPIFEKFSNQPEHDALKFYKLDTEENERAMMEAGVRVVRRALPPYYVLTERLASFPDAVLLRVPEWGQARRERGGVARAASCAFLFRLSLVCANAFLRP
jgi:thiol-disulfide isomerase/thioredoxin